MWRYFVWTLIVVAIRVHSWDRYLLLDPDGKYHVWWNVSAGVIVFQVEVATKGWIGFGISPDGQMARSDVVIGWVINGRIFFQDRHVDEDRTVNMDATQDWVLDWGEENSTHTKLRFHRPLVTCDAHDRIIDESTIRLIYAFHDQDPKSERIFLRHHQNQRGSRSAILLQATYLPSASKEDMMWELRSPNVTIPHNKDTSYLCTVFKLPLSGRKQHVVKIEPILQKGNEKHVYHIVLYKCRKLKPRDIRPYLNDQSYSCYYPDMPDVFSKCQTVYFSWAVGGKSVILPKNVGLPLGGRDGVFFLLEIHYDNPNLISGVTDHSGLRIYYTTNLRKYDGMTLVVGATYEPCVIIPPGKDHFLIAGHGDPNCLGPAIPPGGIKIFAVLPHAHLLGQKFILRHLRGSRELKPIIADRNFDCEYQEYHYLQKEVTVLPNDHLITECTYNSSKRSITTFGGLGTRDEMCLAFILYYPKIERSFAMSAPSCNLVIGLAGVEKVWPESEVLESPVTMKNESFIQYLATYPWQTNYLSVMEDAIRYSPHHSTCILENSTRLIMTGHVTYPNFTEYRQSEICVPAGSNVLQPVSLYITFIHLWYLVNYCFN